MSSPWWTILCTCFFYLLGSIVASNVHWLLLLSNLKQSVFETPLLGQIIKTPSTRPPSALLVDTGKLGNSLQYLLVFLKFITSFSVKYPVDEFHPVDTNSNPIWEQNYIYHSITFLTFGPKCEVKKNHPKKHCLNHLQSYCRGITYCRWFSNTGIP